MLHNPPAEPFAWGAFGMREKSKPKTAAELMAELHANPQWMAAKAKREEELECRSAELRAAELPILEDLWKAGYADVKSVWDFVNSREPYTSAIPILVSHLSGQYPDPIREGIARALSVKAARKVWPLMVEAYKVTSTDEFPRTKEGLAIALASLANDKVIDDVIAMFSDRGNGDSRLNFVLALVRSKDPRATELLLALRSDPAITSPEDRQELEKIIERHLNRNKKA